MSTPSILPPDDDLDSFPSMPTMRGGDPEALGRIDHYDLLRKLGGGGFDVVYLARDTVSGMDVVIKTLHPLLKHDSEETERLRGKFALAARLAHPNIATALTFHPVHDIDIPDKTARTELRLSPGDCVMVMRYAPGVTLSRWRRQFPDGIVPPDLALDIARQVASALDYAHGERIVHRDIKPGNIMVETLGENAQCTMHNAQCNAQGRASSPSEPPLVTHNSSPVTSKIRVRILDFGLAAEIRSSMSRVSTETGDTTGTRPYMAPEQWLGKKQDGRTDQYALACVIYELLSGAPPFAGVFETGNPTVMMATVKNELPEPVSRLPDAANAALLCALSKDPAARFPNCTTFVEALSLGMRGGRFAGTARPTHARWIAAVAVAVTGLTALWYTQSGSRSAGILPPEQPSAESAAEASPPAEPRDEPAQAAELARQEAERHLAEERKAREEAERQLAEERRAQELAEVARKAREEADRQLAEERKAREEVERQLAEERKAREVAEAARKAREEAEAKAHAEALAKAEAQAKAEAERKAREEEERKAEEARMAEAARKEEEARKAEEARMAEAARKEEEERKAEEARMAEAARKEEEERKTREETERGIVRAGNLRTVTLPGGFEMRFHGCPAGTFLMGSPSSEQGRDDDETRHRVTLTKGFWMGETEVTQGQWKALMDGETIVDLVRKGLRDDTRYLINNKRQTLRDNWGASRNTDPHERCGDLDDDVPVYFVNWEDAVLFCRRLTNQERSAGRLPDGYEYRLPTEAEWEYACRAGTTTALPNGRDIDIRGKNNAPALDDIAWYAGNSSVGFEGRGWNTDDWPQKQYPGGIAGPRKVGTKDPNDWGLHDMIGNVWEWCADRYGPYPRGAFTDPLGPSRGLTRVMRGGAWTFFAHGCRPAYRIDNDPGRRADNLGFRVALAPVL